MLMVNWPFNKITFFSSEAIAFFKSFLNMYSNIPLPSRETVPLTHSCTVDNFRHLLSCNPNLLNEKFRDVQLLGTYTPFVNVDLVCPKVLRLEDDDENRNDAKAGDRQEHSLLRTQLDHD